MPVWEKYSGKPSGVRNIAKVWTNMDMVLPDPPISGSEDHFLYARVVFTWDPTKKGQAARVACRYVRENGDETAYKELHFEYGTKDVPFDQKHWESGERGQGGKWQMMVTGGVTKAIATTRYSKIRVIT